MTGLVSLACMFAGAKLWARHPRSANLSWGELVLWSWARRRRAEGTLERGADLLDEEIGELLNPQGRRAQVKVLRELNAALEVRDPYTRGHARRVERHAHRIALALRCSDDDIFDVRLAASLHDVGKIKVPDRVLRKDGPLDDDEWAIMKQHSEVGAELLERLGNPAVVAAVRSHHERWDGLGYPDGLYGTSIPLGARIIAVADTFDAITSCRPYRDRASRAYAVSVLKSEAGRQFDPAVVTAFLSSTPHQAAAFAGMAVLVVPFARKLASQWGVVFNKVGAVSLAGTMTASAFTGVAAVERPLAKKAAKDKTSVTAPPEPGAEEDDGSQSVGNGKGNAFGHDEKAHEGGNGNGKGKGKALGHAKKAEDASDDGSQSVGKGKGKGEALGHDEKAHEGGKGKANKGGVSEEKKPASAGTPAAGKGKSKAEEGAATDTTPAGKPKPEAPSKPETQPKPEPKDEPEAPVVEEPAEPAPAPQPEEPGAPPAPGKSGGKGKPG